MKIAELWAELLRRNRVLAISGLCYLVLFLALAVVALFDSTLVMGINRWIKPMKFALSIAIFQWTLGWLMKHLEARRDKVRIISRGVAITMLAEIIPIAGQAARGRISHFNADSPFDAAVFAFMGVMIALNTLLLIYTLTLFFTTPVKVPKSYLWGIRLGLLLFIVFSLEGGAMVARLGHSVGVPDGGPGVPFINWSTRGGDLRIAHFVGLHALQVLPLTGFLLHRFRAVRPVGWTFAVAFAYGAMAVLLFVWAMMGRPLLALG
ncbi:MAG TPA: hypothetical protein VFD58_27610 [Blastocatellia bacterium]|nr:hypothetical protein [Blastocatellia bacterium]